MGLRATYYLEMGSFSSQRLVLTAIALVLAACGGPSHSAPPPNAEVDATLGAGDVFDVRVFGEEELSNSYRVAQDGTIDMPLVGRVEVAGLEPPHVADLIATRLRDGEFLRDPQVSIFVQEYNSKRVSVVGAVARPGTFPVTSDLTVVEAISMAGGFTSIADQNGTVVTRKIDDDLQRYPVRVEDVTEGSASDFPLQAGDIIYVPERVF